MFSAKQVYTAFKRVFSNDKQEFCIVCQGFHTEYKQCPKCSRHSGIKCLDEAKEAGHERCLFCGSSFEIVEFKPIMPHHSEPFLGAMIEHIEVDGRVGENYVTSINIPAGAHNNWELDHSNAWSIPEPSHSEQARASITIQNNTFEPLNISLNCTQHEIIGEMTVLLDDIPFNSLALGDDKFTIRVNDEVIENCIIEEISHDMREGELLTATIRFRGVPAG